MKIRYLNGFPDVLYVLLFAGVLFATASCSSHQSVTADKPDQVTSGMIEPGQDISDIQFFDSGSFDRKLSLALRKSPETITATFPAAVTTNNIPNRLDKWFFMVEKNEGAVKLEPESGPKTDTEEGGFTKRGLIGEAISLVVGAYNFIKEKAIYSPVKDYDAVVYYKPGTGTITKVVFTRRATETESESEK